MNDLNDAIAIVGMSLRFPKANNPEEFWKNLVEARDCASLLDREELEKLGVAREKLDSPDYVYRSYDLDNIDLFDAAFFGISPREARMADPQLRLMLEATQECIEDSGHVLNGTNTGMYFGVADHKYWLYYNLFESPLEEQNEVAKRIFAVKDFFTTQVCHKLGLNGPGISLNSACSTGLLATHEACNHLLMYDCDYAIAGGCEILKGVGYKYHEGGLSSRDGYIRAFDKDASGTIFGSGVGMVMLRRLSDAIEDGDKIYAVIKSTAVNNDGNQKIGYMAPGVKGQMAVIHEAIERAGISARDISYVEAHGTGTPVGDPIEIESISNVYRAYTNDNQYCAIGSVKTNVGHLSIAAGVAGLIKTALMLHHKKIPPILHFKESNPAIDFETSPFYVSREIHDWHPYNGRRIAGVSAFGVGGTNVHAVLEEAPTVDRAVQPGPYQNVVVLSAKSQQALTDAKNKLADFLRSNEDISMADLAFSLNVGRQKYDYRSFFTAQHTAGLIEALTKGTPETFKVPTTVERQTAFMFPGQGSQYVNMGRQLYENDPMYKQYLDECRNEALKALDVDIYSIMFTDAGEESAARINQTEFTQICLFAVSYSLARLWMHWGVKPKAMIGHSIGEYVAACLSGVFSLADALKLVSHRGKLMQSAEPGSMLSVPITADKIGEYLNDSLSIAGINSPASCTISGTDEAIEQLKKELDSNNIKSTVLHTSHAFHSYMMDPILADYEHVVREVSLNSPEIPFISNLTGTWITPEQATDPVYWVTQLREKVLFSKGIETIAAQDTAFLEIGPGATLCSLLGQHDLPTASIGVSTLPRAKDQIGATEFLVSALGKACCEGIEVNWQKVYGKGNGRRISLPTYSFQRKSYWIDEETLSKPRTAVESLPLEHPLLGRRVVASSKVIVFENHIDKDTPSFLADHRLIDTVIFPGAGYTQMGLEVGKHFIKNKKIKVDEIRFAQAMMLHEGTTKVVQIVATSTGEGCTFEILSRNRDKSKSSDASAWVLHAKGKISPHSVNPISMEMPEIINREGSELLPLSRYYDALKFITFGPSFRAVKRLWIGETEKGELESLGLVELPQHLYPEVDNYNFHPVLLDAAFQVIDGPKISEAGTLPVGLRNFTVYSPVPNSFYVHAVRRRTEGEEYSIGEITVFSEKGTVIARIEHYLQKEIADSVDVQDQLADVLFSLNWEKAKPEITKVNSSGTWVLIGHKSVLISELSNRLRQEGRQVIHLERGLIGEEQTNDSRARYADKDAYESDHRASVSVLETIRASNVDSIIFTPRESGDEDPFALSVELLEVVQLLNKCSSEKPPRLVVVTSGAQVIGNEIHTDGRDVNQSTLWGIGNTITVEHPEYDCLRLDLDPSQLSVDALISDILLARPTENQIVYRDGQRYVPRLDRYANGQEAKDRLRLPSGPYEVRLTRFGTFDSFVAREFIPDLLTDDEVLVEMHSAALNFKETLYVLGFLNPNNRDAIDFDFGMEGAGRIKRVGANVSHLKKGDRVVVWHNGCLSSDFVVNIDKVIRIPDELSFAEAACVPTVFMTAYYALYHLAKIKPGDKVLIHAAAGGVGQVSVQIAQAVGAEIYATASQGKWEYLKSQGIKHIFDSRTLDFADQIKAITNGKGVDIVFNSLSGDFIGRSFDALNKNGRFIEIGKKSVWSADEAHSYRPDVNYQIFEIGEDVVSGGIGGKTIINQLMARILEDFASNRLQPLPMTEFPVTEIQKAYRFLSAGKNIGKVVVNFDRQSVEKPVHSFVDANKTYLITGGLGGLGFLCANWLVDHGAKHIALTGRREPSGDVANRIRDLNKIGINMYFAKGDVGEYDDISSIFKNIGSGDAPLGGILHCAGVLEDAVLTQQTPEKFHKVFRPKVNGSTYLHELSKDLSLDFFVCFSSVSAILDGGGQSNYAAANAYMDRLMSYRRSCNLPGLSVNWGAWSDVGMAAELAATRTMDMSHFISKDEALRSLERMILNQDVQGVVCKLGTRLTSSTRPRMLLNLDMQSDREESETNALALIFQNHPDNTREENMEIFVKRQVNKVLGVDVGEDVEKDAEFVDLGVDSLSMTELKNAVQHGLGKTLKMATFFANPTVARLARHLAEQYETELGTNSQTVDSQTVNGTRKSDEATDSERSIDFVTLENSAREQILFCFPGLNGNVFDYSDFAALSKDKYKVLVGEISSDIETLETDIRVIAADAIYRMKQLQPSGPYSLVGYSYGGVVALEVAHQLQQENRDVKLLMMIDSFPHFHHKDDERFMSFMSALITDSILAPMKLDNVAYDQLANDIMNTPGDKLEQLMQRLTPNSSGGHQQVNVDLLKGIIEAGKKRSLAVYQPPRDIPGISINYLKAGNYPRAMALADLNGFLEEPSMTDDNYSWSNFIDNVFQVYRVSAHHNEILKSDNAAMIIGLIDDLLAATPGTAESGKSSSKIESLIQ